jgi:tetratricopeptide (TPR) repeat protein/predicted Ser/Thr protein kinase
MNADETLPSASARSVQVERFAVGSLVADRYRIERFIASGGMGEVYAVHDLVLDATVALKALRPELEGSAEAIARLRRELAVARTVTNANVCRLYDVGEHEGRAFITMELLEGKTLADVVQHGPLVIDEVERIAAQLVAGLWALHRAALVHRDFKTANVILVGNRAVITDFGLARSTDASEPGTARITVSANSTLIGTPAYMAPEQVEARPATQASDIYALGVVLFELLTGKLPFDEDNPMATATARLTQDPPKPSSLRREVSARWDAIVLRCLAREPAGRFASVNDVLDYRPRSRRWLLAAGSGTLAAAALGLWRYRGCISEEPAPAPDSNELVVMLPVLGDGDWRAEPWRTAITVDLDAALTTAGVPLLSLFAGGSWPVLVGPQRLLAEPDPLAAALEIENVTTAFSIAFARTETEAELVVTLVGAARSQRRFARKLDEIALLVEDVAAMLAQTLGYRAPRKALDTRSIDAALYERYGSALSWFARERTDEEWQAIEAGELDKPPKRLEALVTEKPWLARAAALYAAILQADGEQLETAAETMDHYDRADAVLDRALAVDPQNALAHAVRGRLAMLRYDWKRADAETALANELAPTHARVAFYRGHFLFLSGRFDEAIAHAERSHKRLPNRKLGQATMTWQYYYARRYDDVLRVAEPVIKKLDIKGVQAEWANDLALTYAELGRYEDAVKLADKLRAGMSNYGLAGLVRVYVLVGRIDDAKAIHAQVGTDVDLILQADMADALGETDIALDLLERIVAAHTVAALFIKVARFSTRLRSHPRFQKLLATVNFQ